MQLSCIFVVCVYVDLDSFFANLFSIFLSRLLVRSLSAKYRPDRYRRDKSVKFGTDLP